MQGRRKKTNTRGSSGCTRIRSRRQTKNYLKIGLIILIGITILLGAIKIFKPDVFASDKYIEKEGAEIDAARPDLDVQLLTVNPYSRPGTGTERIKGIVIHYTANPGATAMQNRNYFEGLKDSHETKASSHFVVGLDGEIVQCIPTWETAYASNERNADTVSIECCHADESGKFNKKTYQSMVELTSWLCKKFDLTEKDVIRHYDVTGKNCPKYFVENEKAWTKFRKDVKKAMEKAD